MRSKEKMKVTILLSLKANNQIQINIDQTISKNEIK